MPNYVRDLSSPAVTTIYDDRNYEVAWLRDLKPTAESTALIAAFQDAGAKGLNADDYDAWRWPARVAAIAKIAATRTTLPQDGPRTPSRSSTPR